MSTRLAEGVSPKEGGAVKTVEMNIPSAKITNMAAYNAYLPKSAPIRIMSGTAALNARLVMEEDDAKGFMKMTTSRVDADVDGDRISGVIGLDVAIDGGSAKERRFNISGSTLSIGEVRVTGSHATSGGWSGRVDLGKASVVWKRPMTLDLSGTFRHDRREPAAHRLLGRPQGEQVARPPARPQEHKRQDDHQGGAGQRRRPLRLLPPATLSTSAPRGSSARVAVRACSMPVPASSPAFSPSTTIGRSSS